MENKIILFLNKWSEFNKFLRLFMDKIAVAQAEANDAEFFIECLDKNDIKRFYDDRIVLREMLFKLGEENLLVSTVYEWEELKVKYPIIAQIGYKSPFSLILSIPNIAALIRYSLYHPDRPIRESIVVSLNFIEYLSYKYPKVKENFIHFWHLNIN